MGVIKDVGGGVFYVLSLPFRLVYNIIVYIINLFYDWQLLKSHIISLIYLIIIYCIFGAIYCSIFEMSYLKFFEGTIFPIIGLGILIIQGIIYIFFIPYKLYVTITETFSYIIQIISKLYQWFYSIINAVVNMESYLLNNL